MVMIELFTVGWFRQNRISKDTEIPKVYKM